MAGDHGKPRPCLIVQSDRLGRLGGVLLCPLTSELSTAGPTRVAIMADDANGLAADSLVMVDKITATRAHAVGTGSARPMRPCSSR